MRKRSDHSSLWLLSLLLVGLFLLSSCQVNSQSSEIEGDDIVRITEVSEDSNLSVAIVTDTGGIEDSSFNQSAWEGLEQWGKENGLLQGIGGYDYSESKNDGDYLRHLTSLAEDNFDLIYGVGFLLADSVQLVAKEYPNTMFGIIDTVVDEPNVASITFAEHEGSFLVGIAAALKTNTKKIGFIGGVDSPVINKFEVGFIAGVHAIDPAIEIDVQYAEDFNAFDKGKSLANSMYEKEIDIIYHASGGTGNGVIAEAKEQKIANPEKEIWVIGVDRDQFEEGIYDDLRSSVIFTSMVKRVDVAVKQVSQLALEGKFPGGDEIIFGLDNKGIVVADTNPDAYTEEIKQIVNEWEIKIKNGEIIVPETREQLEQFNLEVH